MGAVVVAATTGLPVVDADGMGRAFPELQMDENLVAEVDGVVTCIVPDLICVLDAESGEPITTETLRYGQRVLMRTPEALAVFGPSCFGLSHEFRPVEEAVPVS